MQTRVMLLRILRILRCVICSKFCTSERALRKGKPNKCEDELTRKVSLELGSGCGGSVGKAVAFDTRGRQFEFSHRQNLMINILTVKC